MRVPIGVAVLIGLTGWAAEAFAAAVRVEVVQSDGKWQLLRDGQPMMIKGVGGSGSRELLAQIGGNSFRTWGTRDLDRQLDEAQKLGLVVTVGISLPKEGRDGFSYSDPAAVAPLIARAREEVLKYKDHPAVLIWAIGNEIEGFGKTLNPDVWKTINAIARQIKQIDPNHPTMAVIAELGARRVESINEHCPDVDIVGINSYGPVATIHRRYTAAGGTKPYVVTEFGPPGIWEIPKNEFGQYPELSSTQKGEIFRRAWGENVEAHPDLCLGAYAFLWGDKQEATSTWFGMLLPDGSRLEAVDVMNEIWTGKPPENRVPKIESITVHTSQPARPRDAIIATVQASDPENDPLKIEWILHREQSEFKTGGEPEKLTDAFPDAITGRSPDGRQVELKLPFEPGGYRLFVYVRDDKNGAATANVPVYVGK